MQVPGAIISVSFNKDFLQSMLDCAWYCRSTTCTAWTLFYYLFFYPPLYDLVLDCVFYAL